MKNIPKWLEIIELRTGTNNTENLEKVLQKIVEALKNESDPRKIKIYRSYSVHSDFSIHLAHKLTKPDKRGSQLGLHLAASLKKFGLLNHQIWHEMKSNHKKL